LQPLLKKGLSGQADEAVGSGIDAEKGVAADSLASRKRAAVELIRNHDQALRISARRFSICRDDSEDAYQRAIEILLSKAPTTDQRQLLPWARTVIKHEALAIRKTRERMLGRPPSAERSEDGDDWIHLIPWPGPGPDEQVEKRELVDRSREALALLKPHELKALTQLAEGYSYAEIASLNGWTRTKVNRCLAEGRARFRSLFRESEAGERCAALEPLISASCDGELDGPDLSELSNHLATCGHCRATLRTFRAAPKAAAALLPAMPVSQSLWQKAQELAISAQLRFQGIGRDPDQSLGAVAASGGTRGAGAAALAKLATVCVGTAGGAAACVAVGVLPAPVNNEKPKEPTAIERPVERPEPVQAFRPESAPPLQQPSAGQGSGSGQEPESGGPEKAVVRQPKPAPPPTPVEQEFTPEAAGTPIPQSAPPPPTSPSPSASSSSVPVGGGGEFGP
jgi:RNA polymerase sigma factor (sigma-70 family)